MRVKLGLPNKVEFIPHQSKGCVDEGWAVIRSTVVKKCRCRWIREIDREMTNGCADATMPF
jgi:hypothetical protein